MRQEVFLDNYAAYQQELGKLGVKPRFPQARWDPKKGKLVIFFDPKRSVDLSTDDIERMMISGARKTETEWIFDNWLRDEYWDIGPKTGFVREVLSYAYKMGRADVVDRLSPVWRQLVYSSGRDTRVQRLGELRYLFQGDDETMQEILDLEIRRRILFPAMHTTRFGAFQVLAHDSGLRGDNSPKDYEKSGGFFPDLISAWDYVDGLQGLIDFSGSTGTLYSTVFAQSWGKGFLVVRGRKFDLEGRIDRNGFNGVFSCEVETRLPGADLDYALDRVDLPPFRMDRSGLSWNLERGDNPVDVSFWYPDKLLISGDARSLKVSVPYVLGEITA